MGLKVNEKQNWVYKMLMKNGYLQYTVKVGVF